MAYPTVSAPYGLQPINRVDGLPYAGAIRQIPINVSTQVYNGDIVRIAAGRVGKRSLQLDFLHAGFGGRMSGKTGKNTGEHNECEFFHGAVPPHWLEDPLYTAIP